MEKKPIYETKHHLCHAGVAIIRQLMISETRRMTKQQESICSSSGSRYTSTRATFLYALSTLCVDYRTPIGFELGLGHKAKYHLNIDLENATLEEVLNEIVGQETGYRWELRDGVINIIPITSRNEFVEKLLNTPIRRFDQPKKLGKFQIRDAIIELPEVVGFT